ncbi:MAG: SDR family NAD(P)-dependent oxidoreductase, partial [Thermoplasmata archaeon]|nr:SDR family NAD(P)-dependent oxidoreductase [Thermoplasmata archaeon]
MNEIKPKENLENNSHLSSNRTLSSNYALAGRKALVTGASRGIGKAIAMALAEAGADVAVNYRSSEATAETVAMDAESIGSNTWTYRADISKPDEVREMKDVVERHFGKIDILVNNAG